MNYYNANIDSIINYGVHLWRHASVVSDILSARKKFHEKLQKKVDLVLV